MTAIKNTTDRVIWSIEIYLLTIRETRCLISGCQYVWVLKRTLFLVGDHFLKVSSHGSEYESFQVSSYEDVVNLTEQGLSAYDLVPAKLLQSCPTLHDLMDWAHQAPLPMGFSRQKCWSGLPCPPPGDLPDPGTEPESLVSPALAGRFYTTSTTWELMTAFNLNHFHQGHTSRYNHIGKFRAFVYEFLGDTT